MKYFICIIVFIIGIAIGVIFKPKQDPIIITEIERQIDSIYFEKEIIKTKYRIKNETDTIYINNSNADQLIKLRSKLRRSL
jgi:hypothetical protein